LGSISGAILWTDALIAGPVSGPFAIAIDCLLSLACSGSRADDLSGDVTDPIAICINHGLGKGA
jgi:hypothetical protein